MEKERIRERVNACYGYAAIAKLRIRQAGPEAFAAEATSRRHRPAGRLKTFARWPSPLPKA
jgi:hypothetical protein